MRRWDVKQIHSPVLGWGRSTTNEASVNSIVFKRKVITWSQQAVASSETRSNLRAFRARHSSKFSHKSNSYTAFENGMENCHFTQRCSCMISEGHIIKFLLYECCTSNKKTHAKCTSHQKQNASLAKTRQILCRWRNLALHIWTIKCICWSQSTRQCIAEFPRSKALAIQGKTKKTCHDAPWIHDIRFFLIGLV